MVPVPVNAKITAALESLMRLPIDDPEQMQRVAEVAARWPIELAWVLAGPKQRAFAEAFHARRYSGHKADIFAALGGNRSGKTIAAGWLDFALYLRELAVAGDQFWCIGQNLSRSIMNQQRELAIALAGSPCLGGNRWNETTGFGINRRIQIACKTGGKATVEFRSADQDLDTFESAKLRGLWADEPISEELWIALIARVVDLDGFKLLSDLRHMWWQEERLVSRKPGDGVCTMLFTTYDNQRHLPPGAVEQMRRDFGSEDAVKMRIYGESVLMEGIVFRTFAQRHIIAPFQIPDYWPRWRAIDYGSSAPTACLWLALSDDETCYVYREHHQAGRDVPHNARCIIAASGDEQYRATLIDPHAVDRPPAVYGTSPTVSEQYAAAGIRARGWPYIQVMGEHACVERIKARLDRTKLKVFSTCTNLIREMRSWKYRCDKNGKPVAADSYDDKPGVADCIDCLKGLLATNPCFAAPRIEVTV